MEKYVLITKTANAANFYPSDKANGTIKRDDIPRSEFGSLDYCAQEFIRRGLVKDGETFMVRLVGHGSRDSGGIRVYRASAPSPTAVSVTF